MSGSLLTFLLLCLYLGSVSCETKCYKNEELRDAEGNVYKCTDDNKPDCCQQDSEFTCCESNSSKTWKEQLQLWGTVAALVVIIGLVFLCCKNDYTLCNGDDSTLAQRMGIRKKPEPQLTNLSQPEQNETPQHGARKYPYDRLPPLPPVTPYPEKANNGGARGGGLYPSAGYMGKVNSAYIEDDDEYRY